MTNTEALYLSDCLVKQAARGGVVKSVLSHLVPDGREAQIAMNTSRNLADAFPSLGQTFFDHYTPEKSWRIDNIVRNAPIHGANYLQIARQKPSLLSSVKLTDTPTLRDGKAQWDRHGAPMTVVPKNPEHWPKYELDFEQHGAARNSLAQKLQSVRKKLNNGQRFLYRSKSVDQGYW